MRLNIFISLCVWATITGSAVSAATQTPALRLSIVYPGKTDKLPYVTRDFVFGSTTPGATVSVNGVKALVAKSGGWIAFLPVSPGQFRLHVEAREGGNYASLDRTVDVAQPPRTLPPAPAQIDKEIPTLPDQDMTLEPGDTVQLLVKGSAAGHATATVSGITGAVQLAETTRSAQIPTEQQRILGDMAAGGAHVGGIYAGEFTIPDSAQGTLNVTYTIAAPDGSQATATAKGTLHIMPKGWYEVGSVVLANPKQDSDPSPYRIVETEPYGNWLFFPPPGTPFAVTGMTTDYYRVALGEDENAWIYKDSLALGAPGAPRPSASLDGVAVKDDTHFSTIDIHLSGRTPFSIRESTDQPASVQVRLYGATSAPDFISYGRDTSDVTAVRWDQFSAGIASVDIRLHQKTLWGYRAYWSGNDLRLEIKKPPVFAKAPQSALKGLLVVIDPGHSPDTGAIGPLGTQERDVNLSIAKRLAARLTKLGARAVLTRTSNVPMGLYQRTGLAARLNADVLISVHNNALPDGVDPFTHHGFSVYYYQQQSLELARDIHDAYRRDIALPDYGLYYDNLALARPTEEPAVLTESAFIMWPPEEMLLRSASYQDHLAATLADGLGRWAAEMRSIETAK